MQCKSHARSSETINLWNMCGLRDLIKAYNVIERCMISSARRLPGAKLPQLRNKAGTLGKTSKCST
jgi:hypothetical protein